MMLSKSIDSQVGLTMGFSIRRLPIDILISPIANSEEP
jgi:hypothetical protein